MRSREAHRTYLQSPWWSRRRRLRLALAEHQCEFRPTIEDPRMKYERFGERCCETQHLEVHHLHYDTLGSELDEDLEVLCRKHHLVRHVEALQCEMCYCSSVVNCEADAIAIVEWAYETVDPRGAMTLDDVLDNYSYSQDAGNGRWCDHCVHMWSKDD